VHLRKVPTLSVDHEDQWASLKTRASDLLEVVSQKCIRIQAAAVKRHLKVLHSAEKAQTPLLFLANVPFYPESDYVISVKKELNRLYILGTLITWYASYPAKSSQILKNHSIMLFTSNANSL